MVINMQCRKMVNKTIRVCLIDADSTIPNLALMRISTWYKSQGADVVLIKANIPYFPIRKKKEFFIPEGFDYYFCSVIYTNNIKYIKGNGITFGGSGFDIHENLPNEINKCPPDYSIYPGNDTSYGFISRGCIRHCGFCSVPEKEGWIHQVDTVDNIVKHNQVKFLDNNILALPNHMDILKELVEKQIKCQFNQGLDIRLLNKYNCVPLSLMNYWKEYTFAFDDISYLKTIESKVHLLNWDHPYKFRFFVYCNPKMEISNICRRVEWIRKHGFLPYIMRDISCWGSKYESFFNDLAAYGNQPNVFKKKNFNFTDFLKNMRHTPERHGKNYHWQKEKIADHSRLYFEGL